MSIWTTLYNLPGTIVSGMSDLVFGNDKQNFSADTPELAKEASRGGIIGSTLSVFYSVSQGISSLIRNNRSTISLAFWVTLGVAASVAIAGAVLASFYPAILASIVGFSLYGISIASLAGANVIAQVAVACGLAGAAASAVTYAGAAVVNACTALVGFVTGSGSQAANQQTRRAERGQFDDDAANELVHSQMGALTKSVAKQGVDHEAPFAGGQLFTAPRKQDEQEDVAPVVAAQM